MGEEKIVPLTDAAFKAAAEAGRQAKNAPTAVMRASVHPLHAGSSLGLSLELRNGAGVTIPVSEILELAAQPAKELAKVRIDAFGEDSCGRHSTSPSRGDDFETRYLLVWPSQCPLLRGTGENLVVLLSELPTPNR